MAKHRLSRLIDVPSHYFLKPADVIVERVGDMARAVDKHGNVIAQSSDHAYVIRKIIDSGYKRIFIMPGEYIINPVQRNTNWFVGLIIKNRVKIVGSGMGLTILKFTDKGASGRIDGISFDEGDLYDIEIKDMTIDGELIDWSKIGYGEGIRPVNPTNTVNNALLENLEIKNWNVGWGIGWGYTKSFGERLTIRNICGENLGRGVVWIAGQNYCRVENIYGKSIIGYEPTNEGDIISIESGINHSIDGVYGDNVPRAIISLSGTIRINVSNVQGSTKLYGIRLTNINHANIVNVKIDGNPATTYGIYWKQSYISSHVSIVNANLERHKYGIYLDGDPSYYISDFEFRGRILSWDSNQSTAIYMRYVKSVLIDCPQISWGYGTFIDVDYVEDIEIKVTKYYGVKTMSVGANVTNIRRRIMGVIQTYNSGTATFSGDGTTTQFKIAHGLVDTPSKYGVTPASTDASGAFYVTADDTYLYVNYSTAPPAGTNNVVLKWWAEV